MADAGQIAAVHVESWKTTYKGLVAQEYLERLNKADRAGRWERIFQENHPDSVVFVAENAAGRIVGFASGGPCREALPGYNAELYAIYILQDCQGNGIGRRLIGKLAEHLSGRKYRSLMAWVLKGNTAYDFYRQLGGEAFTEQQTQIGNELLPEIGIGWPDINKLL